MDETGGVPGTERPAQAQGSVAPSSNDQVAAARDALAATPEVSPPTATDPGHVPVSIAEPTRWILIVGGAMALGWLLLLLGAATGGGTAALAFLIMIPSAIWWRVKTGPQLGPKASSWVKNVVDQRTADKVTDSHWNEAIDRATTTTPGLGTPGLDRAQARIGGWMLKRWLLMAAGAFLCFVRPVMAGFGEARILMANR